MLLSSLRAKLLFVFAVLALLPLVGLSVFDYLRSQQAVRQLITDQTSVIAERAARHARDRFAIAQGDLQLLASNTEIEQLYQARSEADSTAADSALVRARAYLNEAWRVVGPGWGWIAFYDAAGREIEHLGALPDASEPGARATFALGPVHIVSVPIPAPTPGAASGKVMGALKLAELVPREQLDARVGHHGYTVISAGSKVVYDSRSAHRPRGYAALVEINRVGAPTVSDTTPVLSVVRYVEDDTARLATVAFVPGVPIAVISAGAVNEFARSFASVRATNLLFGLLLTAALGVAFVLITRRMVRPLEALTAAAGQIGRGNFNPVLPIAGDDEVGRLTAALAAMSGHIDHMMRELESSRQVAAVGSFARQVAHEIRNPLTAIKLNLQGLQRDVRAGRVNGETEHTIEVCLREIQRLDRVVRGVLDLARAPRQNRQLTSFNGIVERAVELVRPQFADQRIELICQYAQPDITVNADSEQLVGMFLNLFLNAGEAMPDGGTLSVSIERGDAGEVIRVTVRDTGPGVPPEISERVFEPFFTTKEQGSGLGLAVALRDAERHRGRIRLIERPEKLGAEFVVELPIAEFQPA